MYDLSFIAIIITVLTVIISILCSKWNTYDLTKNKRKIRLRSNLLIIFCIISIIFLLIFQRYTYIKQMQDDKKKQEIEYSNSYEEILFEIGNENYIKALRKTDKLLNNIEDEKEKIELYGLQGNIYMYIGLTENNNIYLENAVLAFNKVVFLHSFASKIQIIEAKAGLGISYIGINNKIYDKKLEQIVKDIENADLKEDLLGQICLGAYYTEEYFSNFQISDLENALSHYEMALKLEKSFSTENIVENNLYIILQEKLADLYLKYAAHNIMNNGSMLYLEKAIYIYSNLLDFYEPEKNKYNYYKCLKEQSRCYVFLKDENENLRTAYLTKAYNNMRTVLYFDDKELDDLMLGYYLFIPCCNVKDINMLFSRYNRLLKTSLILSDENTIRETKLNMLCCSYFWWIKSASKKYYKIGKHLLKEIKNKYYDFYNSEQQQSINDIENNF